MKCFLAVSFFCALALAPGVSAQQPTSLPDLVERIRPSIVTVETFDALGKPLGTATGFFIGEDRFITTRHAVESAAHVAIVHHDGARRTISRLLAEDEQGDLVLLEVENPPRDVPSLAVTREPPRDGQDIFVMGVPLGIDQTVTRGIIAGRLRPTAGIPMLQINASISRGSSGSPVMNMDGVVIGIAAARIPEGDDFNLAIPAERIFHLDPCPMPFTDWARRQLERQRREEVTNLVERSGIKPAFPIAVAPEVRKVAASVVMLRSYDEQGEVLRESDGFFVMPNRVLTARTTLRDAARAEVQTATGETFEVQAVVGDDPLGGLMLLEVRTEPIVMPVPALDTRRPYRDEPLIVVPARAQSEPDFPQHRVTMTTTNLPGFGPALSVGPVAPLGRPGNPVVSARGRVLGVVVERADADRTMRYVVPADRIRDHLFSHAITVSAWSRRADDPGPAGGPLARALPFMLTERWRDASAIMERGVTPELDDAERWLVIALCRSYQRDWPAVIDAANHALAIDDSSSLAHFLLGIGYAGQVGRDPQTALELARDSLRKAIELDKSYSYHGYIRLAAILADFGELDQGVTVMEQAVALWPDRPETHQMLASMYVHRATQLITGHQFGQGDRFRRLSLEQAVRAVELAPYASWAYRQLAQSAALNETAEPAIRAARQAVALAPDDPLTLDNLGRIYLICGDSKSALNTYRTLKELDAGAAEGLLRAIQQKEGD